MKRLAKRSTKAKPRNWLSQSAGIVIIRDHKVLLLLKKFGKTWEFPKGRMEAGETIEATARREVSEETGLRNVKLIPGWRHAIRFQFRFQHKVIRRQVTFLLGRASGPVKVSTAHCEYRWVTADEALTLLRYRNYHLLIKEAMPYISSRNQRKRPPKRKANARHSQTT